MLHRLHGQELILFLAVSVLFLFMFRGTGTTVLFARGSVILPLTFYVSFMLLIATLYQLQSTSKIIYDIYL